MRSHDWIGPDGVIRHVHCKNCKKIFEINKPKGYCHHVENEFDEEPFDDDEEYCQCGNDPMEEEEIDGKCFACGRFLP